MLSIELETFNSLFVVVLLSLCIATGGREAVSEDGKGLTATKQLTHVCAALRKEYDLNLVFIFCPGFRCVTI